MKTLPVLASLVALMWLLTVLLRLPHRHVPPVLIFYLGAQAVFTLVGWLGSLQWGFSNRNYAMAYTWTEVPVLVLAFILLCSACWNRVLWPLIPVGTAMTLGLYVVGRRVIPNVQLSLSQLLAALFIACGLSLLASLVVNAEPLWNTIRFGVGLFWLIEGFFHYFWVVSIVRNRESAITKAYLLPGLIACAIWGWLALSLSTLQGELSREAGGVHSLEAVPQPVEDRR